MAIPLKAQPILHILGSGKGHKSIDLIHTICSYHLGARFLDLVETHVVEVLDNGLYTSAIGTLL